MRRLSEFLTIVAILSCTAALRSAEPLDQWDERVINPVTVPSCERLIYANQQFIAVGGDGRTAADTNNVAVSRDGIQWSAFSLRDRVTFDRISDIVWGDNRYVAIGSLYPTNFFMLTSLDLTNWNIQKFDSDGWFGFAVAHGNGKFVAVADHTVVISTDGTNWSAPVKPPGLLGLRRLVFGNGRFVGLSWGGIELVSSVDGINWSSTNVFVPDWRNEYRDLAYGNGVFVAAGGDSEWNPSLSGSIAVSTDGIHWIFPEVPRPQFRWFQSIGFGNGVFVASGNVAYSSADGAHWIPRADHFNSSPGGTAFGNRSFLAFAFSSKATWQSGPFFNLKMHANGQMELHGPVGRSFRVEMSTSLGGTNWQTVGQLSVTNQSAMLVTPANTTNAHSFFRAVLLD